MVGAMTVMATSFKRTCSCTAVFSAPDPQQATVHPPLCRRHLDTHRQVWLSLLWGHCSFLLAPGAHKALFVPSKSLHWSYQNTLFQQRKRRLYTWTSPSGQYQSLTDYILCSQRWRSSIQSAKTRLGADYGSDHELLIAKFRLKLKKIGKTTRPLRYDLNQIPYDYIVEVTNRFKGLDLIDSA